MGWCSSGEQMTAGVAVAHIAISPQVKLQLIKLVTLQAVAGDLTITVGRDAKLEWLS
jgi:hypothetical protein